MLLLRRLLNRAGYDDVHATTDPLQAMPLFDALRPDLVLLDLHMPGMDGFAVLEALSRRVPPGEYLPVLVLTADATRTVRERSLGGGARDFVTKPFDATEVVQRVRNLLQTRQLHLALAAEQRLLDQRVRDRSAALDQALAEVRASAQARSQFLANVSHELRTPLTAMRGALGLLPRAAGALPPQAVRLLEIAGGNLERLMRIVEDLLLLQGLESGELRPRSAPVDVAAVARAAAARFEGRARERGLALAVDAPADLSPLPTDEVLLDGILSRLLDNAVRFTERGEVQVVVRGERGLPASMTIRDTGPGIPPERVEAVLEAFEQADNSDTRRYGGLGLGLAICRAAAMRIGWRLRVESEPGGGSRFILIRTGGGG